MAWISALVRVVRISIKVDSVVPTPSIALKSCSASASAGETRRK
jgi:hypothetical protein